MMIGIRYARYLSFAFMCAAVFVARSGVVKAAAYECIAIPGYLGYWFEGEEIDCADEDIYCSAWCDFCHHTDCAYVNFCTDGDSSAGACDWP
jgi:hypothetical protein